MGAQLVQPLLSFNWNLLFTMVTLVVLFFILKHFFFEKVHDFMEQRQKSIEDALANADETSKLADQKLADYEAKIADASDEGRAIVNQARSEAAVQAAKIIDDAKEDARGLMEHTKKAIEAEHENARADMKKEITDLAMMAAQQIMERELAVGGQEEIVDNIIKKAGKDQWQN